MGTVPATERMKDCDQMKKNFKFDLAFELQVIVAFYTACAVVITSKVPGWIGWALMVAEFIGGMLAAIGIRNMYDRRRLRR